MQDRRTTDCLLLFHLSHDIRWPLLLERASTSVWSFKEVIVGCGSTLSLSREHIPAWCWCVEERPGPSAGRMRNNSRVCDWLADEMTANAGWYNLFPPHWAVGLQQLRNRSSQEKHCKQQLTHKGHWVEFVRCIRKQKSQAEDAVRKFLNPHMNQEKWWQSYQKLRFECFLWKKTHSESGVDKWRLKK